VDDGKGDGRCLRTAADAVQAIENDEAEAGKEQLFGECVEVGFVSQVQVLERICKGGENALDRKSPSAGALKIEGLGGFGFAPEDGARLEEIGGAIGPWVAAQEAGRQAQGEGRFTGASVAGEDSEHTGREPEGPAPGEGRAALLDGGPRVGGRLRHRSMLAHTF
jgi:hypothetical protein